MAGQVVAFRRPEPTADEPEALIAVLAPLHALISIDPLLGASPVRVYFVLDPQARRRICECVQPGDRPAARSAGAFALIAYDFPFALHIVETNKPQFSRDRAKDIVTCSANLQGDALRAAGKAFGVLAEPIVDFDADALKATFFSRTQESVIHLFRLALEES
jgi:hypothetical protein